MDPMEIEEMLYCGQNEGGCVYDSFGGYARKKPTKIELEGSLESMQKFVGGTIQVLYPFDDPVAIICNDEGKQGGLEYNRALRDENGSSL